MKKIVIISLLLGLCLVVKAQYKSANEDIKREMVSRITSASEAMRSLKCNFTQRKTVSILAEEMVSEGSMTYKYNDKLRWEYKKPYRYRFTMNGDKIMIDTEGSKNVIDVNQSRVFRQISRIIMSGINGRGIFDDKSFGIRYLDSAKECRVVLTPKQKELKTMFSTVTLTFSKSDYTVDSVEIEETGGDRTVIKMTDKQMNVTIPDETFALH